jgi:Ca2+:H+ antiporter
MESAAHDLPADYQEHDTESENEPEPEAVPFLSSSSSENPRPLSKRERRPKQLERVLSTYIPHATRIVATQLLNINILWPFVPLGPVVGALKWKAVPTSAFNFLAIIPLSAAVSDASDKLSDQFGDLTGALINATFGNAVELIVSPPS